MVSAANSKWNIDVYISLYLSLEVQYNSTASQQPYREKVQRRGERREGREEREEREERGERREERGDRLIPNRNGPDIRRERGR